MSRRVNERPPCSRHGVMWLWTCEECCSLNDLRILWDGMRNEIELSESEPSDIVESYWSAAARIAVRWRS